MGKFSSQLFTVGSFFSIAEGVFDVTTAKELIRCKGVYQVFRWD